MHILNYVGQIALGIVYGIYLAYFAPASQRQKVKQRYEQQLTVKARSKTTEISAIAQPVIVEPSSVVVEDPWLLEAVTPTKVKRSYHATAIAPLLLPPAKTSCKKKDKSPNTIPEAIAQMTVAQLRKLCSDRDIQWRNVQGVSKHLTKAQMINALYIDKVTVTT